MDKRQRDIRTANDQLRSKLGSVTDKDFEVCMQKLYQDSVSLSTTYPSLVALAGIQPNEVKFLSIFLELFYFTGNNAGT